MKKAPYIIFAACLMLFSACKKDSSKPGDLIIGKWQETKLDLKLVTSTDTKDTIYYSADFDSHDYIQFNKDNTADVSASAGFTITGKVYYYNVNAAVGDVEHYKYALNGNNLSLTPVLQHPTNGSTVISQVVETLTKNQMVIRTTTSNGVEYSPAYNTVVTTAYYTRAN